MFDDPAKLALGLATGIVFGVLLQKGQVAKFQVIIGQLLFRDWTVFKIMGTAIIVGMIGVNLLIATGMASLHIQPASLARILFGGLFFGVGMAILGLCPGTSVAASGEGRRDAMVGVFGMLLGAGAYVVLFPTLQPLFQSMPDAGKVTLPQITGSPIWVWIIGITVVLGTLVAMLHRRSLQPRT